LFEFPMIYKKFIRPLLFLFKPEFVHNFVICMANILPLRKKSYVSDEIDGKNFSFKLGYLNFKNRLGLAAGMDKDAKAIKLWNKLGFSHVEVGTVTPMPQSGNPKPRLFRLVKDEAIINRMGFNNQGPEKVRLNILRAKKKTHNGIIVGVNIGKNMNTPVKNASEDYQKCMEILYDSADYFSLNVSSPNTEGLRDLQSEKYLDELLAKINAKNSELSLKYKIPRRIIFLKVAPDLLNEEIEFIFNTAVKNEIDGIIATNTTIRRENIVCNINEEGGLSGKPLKKLSNEILIKFSVLNSENKLTLIACGGVFDKNNFKEKIKLGAELVQIYTGFVYEGPGIIKKILQ